LARRLVVTRHRRSLDRLLAASRSQFTSEATVLDVGGRDRGSFEKPRSAVRQWIFADIDPAHHPDVVLDVARMSTIDSRSVDVVLATELFEHVEDPERGLAECHRVLADGGVLILSAPFLHRVHEDPTDFQRWTAAKWRLELERAGFGVEQEIVTGRFFSSLADHVRALALALPRPLRYLLYALLPAFDLLARLDERDVVRSHPTLGAFHAGYFIVARKR
jgi:SAM-dependent methyltransferase